LKTKNLKLRAIVVLPAGRAGRIQDERLRRWLSKGRLQASPAEDELLYSVVDLFGMNARDDGLAALQFWGQTGDRSGAWMAAADPVHLEARLDYLCLYDLRGRQMPMSDLRPIFEFLQSTFGSGSLGFARIGRQGYLRGENEIATASASARAVNGLRPDEFMPKQGENGDADGYHRLLSEVQMALHEHEINEARVQAGLREVNSLWIWGGGVAPDVTVEPILPLFANDPLFKGFWLSRTGVAEPWSDGFEACVALAQKGFVAVTPDTEAGQADSPDRYLAELRRLMSAGVIGHVTLLFRDGLRADISPRDRYRFWRRESPMLAPTAKSQ
jgi:hypothetical protein